MTAIAAAVRKSGHRPGRAGAGRGPRAAAPRLQGGGLAGVRDAPRRAIGGSTPTAMDFEAYWAARPAQLRNTAKRRGKTAGLEIEIYDRFDAARLGRLRGRLPGELEARGRLVPVPARARRAGGRGRDAAARRRAQGRPAGRGAALAGREWRGDHPQARLCRGRQGDVARDPARHGDVPPRDRHRPGARDRLRHRRRCL